MGFKRSTYSGVLTAEQSRVVVQGGSARVHGQESLLAQAAAAQMNGCSSLTPPPTFPNYTCRCMMKWS